MAEQDYTGEPGYAFEKVVFVKIGDRWQLIETGQQALRCLRESFPETDGPSYRRALVACESFLAGKGTREGAQATFVVATMEAELPFEVHDDGPTVMERRVAIAAENGLIEMLSELD